MVCGGVILYSVIIVCVFGILVLVGVGVVVFGLELGMVLLLDGEYGWL